ncbi:MAG: hypothetical protein GEU86_13080 [Actinophytocola sp.]|nr:hypothetical protein [Actinophytocola sp.]
MARSGLVTSWDFSAPGRGERALVMAVVAGLPAQAVLDRAVDRAVADGADLVDLGSARAEYVTAVRRRHPELPIAVAVSGDEAGASGADLVYAAGDTDVRLIAPVAAAMGAGVICAPEAAASIIAQGRRPSGVLVTPATVTDPADAGRATELVSTGWPVLLTLAADDVAGEIAATAVAAMAGVRVFRTRRVKQVRRTVDMVASIAGTRPPARARRALA